MRMPIRDCRWGRACARNLQQHSTRSPAGNDGAFLLLGAPSVVGSPRELNMKDPMIIDWSTMPSPMDDGRANHLMGQRLPRIALNSTDGDTIDLSRLKGRAVIYAYPRKKLPDEPPPDGWLTMASEATRAADEDKNKNSYLIEPTVGIPPGSDAKQEHFSFDEFGHTLFARMNRHLAGKQTSDGRRRLRIRPTCA